jgi:ATP-binding cassette subfamily F protein 3
VTYEGDLTSYNADLLARAREARKTGSNGSGARRDESALTRQEERRLAANARAELAPLKKRVDSYEREIETINRKLAKLDNALADHALYDQQPERALRLMKERGVLAKDLGEAEMLWLEASERYEQARSGKQDAGTA